MITDAMTEAHTNCFVAGTALITAKRNLAAAQSDLLRLIIEAVQNNELSTSTLRIAPTFANELAKVSGKRSTEAPLNFS